MGLIEQAAKRLEELRRAGVEVPANVESTGTVHTLKQRPSPSHESDPSRPPNIVLDLEKLASEGYVTPDKPRSRVADEFRVIKRPLLANIANEGAARIKYGNLIMVTSAMPGEGKTQTSINLAMSLAMELDRAVLLVDADVARPSLPRRLGLPDTRGLLDVLCDKSVGLSQVILRTNVEKLTFLSSGNRQERATEMLASEAMIDLLDELANRYSDRIVVFDSPPLLVTTESRVLATHLGQIVFVVHAETTLQSQVKQALATVEACQVKLMVLNGARTVAQGAYGYGYGYGYGNGR
jgi:exopolysaccharide/PEP-CTERM locus tyrosine autokinase